MRNLSNGELLVLLKTAKHNLSLIRPQLLQKSYVINAQVNVDKAIADIEDRIEKTRKGLR